MNPFEKLPGKPSFDQPKTPEPVKTPAEAANELRAKINSLNEKLWGERNLEKRLQIRCDREGHQEACRIARRQREEDIPRIEKELERAAQELKRIETLRRAA